VVETLPERDLAGMGPIAPVRLRSA
jgi:hypothetical protein